MKRISLEQLKQAGAIYFNKIEEGFEQYPYHILEAEEEQLKNGLKEKIKQNGEGHCFVDFYYGRLDKKEKERVDAVLTKAQRAYIDRMQIGSDDLYFELTDELFEITFHLSVNECLFSTYYFTGNPSTVWSNYNKQLVVFERP